jgi:hypothetical protein
VNNDVGLVPLHWYYPAAIADWPRLSGFVPAGNSISLGDYQKKWLGVYAQISRDPTQYTATGTQNPATDATLTSADQKKCPEGDLLTLPSILPNITKCEGRAFLGAVCLAGGVLLVILGVAVMAAGTKAGRSVIAAAPLVK